MKKFYLFIACQFIFLSLSAQPQQVTSGEWSKSFGGTDDDIINCIVTDSDGNSYISGYFYSTLMTMGSFTLTSQGGADIFVAKLDKNGTVIWAKSYGGSDLDANDGLCLDQEGNLYFTGYYRSPYMIIEGEYLLNDGDWDIFLCKFTPDGNLIWLKEFGGNGEELSHQIAPDSEGNVYFTGHFDSDILYFDEYTLNCPNGLDDFYLVKLTGDGDVLWARQAIGDNADRGFRLVTDTLTGDVIVSGSFGSNSITFGAYTLLNYGSWDPFVVRYDASGNVLWAKGAKGSDQDYGLGIGLDNQGNIYVTGYFASPYISFDSYSILNQSSGVFDTYVVKYNPKGMVLWAEDFGSTGEDRGTDVRINTENRILLTGFFSYQAMFGDTILQSNGSADGYLIEIDTDGTVIRAENIGGSGYDWIRPVVHGSNNERLAGGIFKSAQVIVGDNTLINKKAGYYDIFIKSAYGSPLPSARFSYHADGLSVSFFNESTNALTYAWSFGDGATSDEENPLHTYPAYEQYEVSLVASNVLGSDTAVQFISLYPVDTYILKPGPGDGKDAFLFSLEPESNAGGSQRFQCAAWTYQGTPGIERSVIDFDLSFLPENLEIISASLSLYANYNDPYDDGHSSLLGPNTTYLKRVTSPWEEYTVAWTIQPSTTDQNMVILEPTNEPYKNYLDIDVTPLIRDNLNDPEHGHGIMIRLETEQYYRRMAFASSDNPDPDTWPELKLTYAIPSIPPVIYFNYTLGDDLTVSFYNRTLFASDWLWEFGDGAISDEKDPSHMYLHEGTYDVTLVASNSFGNDTLTMEVSVCQLPQAVLEVVKLDGLTIQCHNHSLYADSYFLSFGNGDFSLDPEVIYTYHETGMYQLVLTAFNQCSVDTAVRWINICTLPVSAFEFVRDSLVVSFINASVDADSCMWLFGDGTGSFNWDPVHIYHSDGSYEVTLITWNDCGKDTLSLILGPLAMEELNDPYPIRVFPNPSTGWIRLVVPDRISPPVRIDLYTLEGLLIRSRLIKQPDLSKDIYISSLSAGCYLLTITTADIQTTHKIIVL